MAMDRLIVTPPGEEPPPMGVAMYDGPENRKAGRPIMMVFEPDNIYSFSFFSINLDFCLWKVGLLFFVCFCPCWCMCARVYECMIAYICGGSAWH